MPDIHKHCPVCGVPIPLNETTCSEKCENLLVERQNKMKKSRIILFLLFIIFITVWAYVTLLK